MKKAILQVADTGPLESIVIMLRSIGYECFLPSENLKKELRHIGCDTVLDIAGLMKGWGYDRPFPIPNAEIKDMSSTDLYVDIKAHRAYPKIVKRWSNLENKILWYRIQGGSPEHVINARGDHGDEVNPPCPILTPNLWYALDTMQVGTETIPSKWKDRAYACWPPFYRFDEFAVKRIDEQTHTKKYSHPLCLIHNLSGWGYDALVDNIRELGVKCFGAGSPDGLIQHREVGARLSSALAMVHLKSNDAPGYALYECLASGCPLICSRRLIWRCRMQDLLIPGETCLVFDRETHEGLNPQDVYNCTREISSHLEALSSIKENRRIGQNGQKKLLELMWSEGKKEDVESLKSFMQRNFP